MTLSLGSIRTAILLTLLAPGLAGAQSLTKSLTDRLAAPPFDRHHWGIAVLDERGRLLFGHNAERLFTPASNTKLIVTAAATMLLGPDTTVRTPVYLDGPIEEGILRGNVILYGNGDPTWTRRCYAVDTLAPGACLADPFAPFGPVAAALKRLGVRQVTGQVIGDGSFFEAAMHHPSWEVGDLVWGYGAPVSGLGFNENTIQATIRPGPTPGSLAVIALWPDLGALVIDNRLITVPDSARTEIDWARAPDGATAVVTGTIRASERERRNTLAAPDPNRYAALALHRVLADSGIVVLGGVSGTTDPLATQPARHGQPAVEIVSRPIRDWVFPVLNVSQNWVAEMLLKLLGKRFESDGSWQAGLRVERRFLIDVVGADSTQFSVQDGSGLSAQNSVSPLTFARLLAFMQQQPQYAAFAAGMPQSGSIGSLRNRFLTTPVVQRVWAKTGSIAQVNSLSGYIGGTTLGAPHCRIFSVQAMNHILGGQTMIRAIDSVVSDIGTRSNCSVKR